MWLLVIVEDEVGDLIEGGRTDQKEKVLVKEGNPHNFFCIWLCHHQKMKKLLEYNFDDLTNWNFGMRLGPILELYFHN